MILAITSLPPDAATPLQTGTTVWLLTLLNALLQVGDVTLLTPSPPAGQLLRSDRLTVRLVSPGHPQGFLRTHLRNMVRPEAWPGAWAVESAEVHHVVAACSSGDYDVCVLFDERAAIYLPALPSWLPVILVRHSLLGHAGAWSWLWATSDHSTSSRLRTYLRGRYYFWLARRFNVWTTRRADVVLAGTTTHVNVLRHLAPGIPVWLLPCTGVAPRLPPNSTRHVTNARTPLVAVFVADYRWPPNAHAVRWFVSEVLPELTPDVRRGFRFRFIGQSPPADVAEHVAPDSGIEFAGFVEDLESALAEADVGIIPLRHGDGIKVKSVTMLGFGLPTVSTSIGVEGLPGGVCLVADGAADFAAALTRCREPQLRTRLSRDAIKGIRQYVAGARPEEVFRRAIEVAGARRATAIGAASSSATPSSRRS